jgi:uncharacterized protein YkwD
VSKPHILSRYATLPALFLLLLLLAACQSPTGAAKQANTTRDTEQQQSTTLKHHTAPSSTTAKSGDTSKNTTGTKPVTSAKQSGSGNTATPQPTTSTATTPASNPTPASGSGISANGTATEMQVTQQLFNLINSDRAAQGLPAYSWNTILANGARQHSINMTSCGLTHACPGEPNPCQREINEGINYMACGENIGYSSPNPDAFGGAKVIEQSMLAEQPPNDGHRLNLLSSTFHLIGVGVVIDAKGLVWITEDFAN